MVAGKKNTQIEEIKLGDAKSSKKTTKPAVEEVIVASPEVEAPTEEEKQLSEVKEEVTTPTAIEEAFTINSSEEAPIETSEEEKEEVSPVATPEVVEEKAKLFKYMNMSPSAQPVKDLDGYLLLISPGQAILLPFNPAPDSFIEVL